jgi:hypothetical protein
MVTRSTHPFLALISPDGLIGVVDFYVQSKVDFAFRNYTGGSLGRRSQRLNDGVVVGLCTWIISISLMPLRRFFLIFTIESLTSLISPDGLIGVVDFYVQSKVDFAFRNYTLMPLRRFFLIFTIMDKL